MRVVICDDDERVRAVVASLLADRGDDVVAECETSLAGVELLQRTRPDVAIIDVSLRHGSGIEVLREAAVQGCDTVVFTSYAGILDPDAPTGPVVEKPDFDGLEAALDALAVRRAGAGHGAWHPGGVDRRRTPPHPGLLPAPPAGVEPLERFYSVMAEAWPGDAIVALRPADDGGDPEPLLDAVGVVARNVVRAQDHVSRRGNTVLVLLVAGDPDTAMRVHERLRRAWSDHGEARGPLDFWHVVVGPDELPGDALIRLWSLAAAPPAPLP